MFLQIQQDAVKQTAQLLNGGVQRSVQAPGMQGDANTTVQKTVWNEV